MHLVTNGMVNRGAGWSPQGTSFFLVGALAGDYSMMWDFALSGPTYATLFRILASKVRELPKVEIRIIRRSGDYLLGCSACGRGLVIANPNS